MCFAYNYFNYSIFYKVLVYYKKGLSRVEK